MKLAELFKVYAPRRSSAGVSVSIYNKTTGKTETVGLTSFEVEHFDEMRWPLSGAKVESFEISHEDDIARRPILRVNVSIKEVDA